MSILVEEENILKRKRRIKHIRQNKLKRKRRRGHLKKKKKKKEI